ncbi:MAG: DedA family protein [Oscillospiraceae bacterium]
MQEMLIEFINNFGYFGILLLIWIENIFPPIPSEVVLIFGGFITTYTDMNVWLVIIFATAGSMLGAAALYGLGRALNKDRLKKLFEGRVGKILRLKPQDADKAFSWFERYEYKAVFICRCVPIVRSLISIPAGISKMKPLPFFSLTLAGSAIWNTVLVWVGKIAGNAWEETLQYFSWYSKAAIVLLGIAAIVVAFIVYKKIKNRKPADSTDGD